MTSDKKVPMCLRYEGVRFENHKNERSVATVAKTDTLWTLLHVACLLLSRKRCCRQNEPTICKSSHDTDDDASMRCDSMSKLEPILSCNFHWRRARANLQLTLTLANTQLSRRPTTFDNACCAAWMQGKTRKPAKKCDRQIATIVFERLVCSHR